MLCFDIILYWVFCSKLSFYLELIKDWLKVAKIDISLMPSKYCCAGSKWCFLHSDIISSAPKIKSFYLSIGWPYTINALLWAMVIFDVDQYFLTGGPRKIFKAKKFKSSNGNFKSDQFFHFHLSERPPKEILELNVALVKDSFNTKICFKSLIWTAVNQF